MNYNQVKFTAAFGTSKQLPASVRPEIAFVGRSNAGKSSLLNKLFNRKSLAKVSSKPGKTSTINFFNCGDVDFVDLPGYGYAQVSKSEKERWSEMIEGYFNQDRDFCLVVSLMDVRHPASKLDESMVSFLAEAGIPFMIVATKADKLSASACARQVAALRKQLQLGREVSMISCSSLKGTGIDKLKGIIEERVALHGQAQVEHASQPSAADVPRPAEGAREGGPEAVPAGQRPDDAGRHGETR